MIALIAESARHTTYRRDLKRIRSSLKKSEVVSPSVHSAAHRQHRCVSLQAMNLYYCSVIIAEYANGLVGTVSLCAHR
jgi:hypothetical protein